MVWRYILAFVLSIVLLFGWPVYIAGKRENNQQVQQAVLREEKPKQAAEVVAVEPEQGAKDGEKPIPVDADGEKPIPVDAGGEKPAGKKVDLVPGRFRVVVDPSRGSISGVTLLNHFTAVEGDPERKEQPLLLGILLRY